MISFTPWGGISVFMTCFMSVSYTHLWFSVFIRLLYYTNPHLVYVFMAHGLPCADYRQLGSKVTVTWLYLISTMIIHSAYEFYYHHVTKKENFIIIVFHKKYIYIFWTHENQEMLGWKYIVLCLMTFKSSSKNCNVNHTSIFKICILILIWQQNW